MHRLIVKPYRPVYAYLAVIVAGVVLSVGIWLLLDYYWLAITQRFAMPADDPPGQNVNQKLESENQALRKQIIRLERELQVDRMTAVALQKDIMKLQGKVRELMGELEFYQGIMTSTQNARGLNIHKLLVKPIKPAQYYRFRLVLTHTEKNGAVFAEGTMDMSIEGVKNGKMHIAHLKDMIADSKWPPDFKFKNFKRIDGNLILPEGFEPLGITVQLHHKGKNNTVIEKTFDWVDAIKHG